MKKKTSKKSPSETPIDEKSISRRDLLQAGAFVLAAPGLLRCNGAEVAESGAASEMAAGMPPGPTAAAGRPLPDLSPVPGLDHQLDIDFAKFNLPGSPGEATFRAYHHRGAPRLPGPTFAMDPGQELSIKVVNRLPQNTDTPPPCGNGEHHLNTTNFHTHGFHVSPGKNANGTQSDNVLIKVKPQSEEEFEFHLPAYHVPGTHWYHPHNHGSTDEQVKNGMSGALIVRGGLDDELAKPELLGKHRDRILVIQQLKPAQGVPAEGEADAGLMAEPPGRMQEMMVERQERGLEGLLELQSSLRAAEVEWGKSLSINGVYNPTIDIEPGEIQRWRFINAAVDDTNGYVGLALRKQEDGSERAFLQIAQDGVPLTQGQPVGQRGKPKAVEHLQLVPGSRADVLVRLAEPETTFELVKTPFQQFSRFAESDVDADEEGAIVLATIRVGKTPRTDQRMPKELTPVPEFLADLRRTTPAKKRRICFTNFIQCPTGEWNGTVNCYPFDKKRIDQCMEVGTVEEWTVFNVTSGGHPFHIHVNPFLVTKINGKDVEPIWRDTVNIPRRQEDGSPGSVTFLMRLRKYTGDTVFHCHILSHEDMGMMQHIRIAEKGKCVPPTPATEWSGKPCPPPAEVCCKDDE